MGEFDFEFLFFALPPVLLLMLFQLAGWLDKSAGKDDSPGVSITLLLIIIFMSAIWLIGGFARGFIHGIITCLPFIFYLIILYAIHIDSKKIEARKEKIANAKFEELEDVSEHATVTEVKMTGNQFSNRLEKKFRLAEKGNEASVTIRSGDLHREVGGYPGPDHRMPMCCDAMYAAMQDGDVVVGSPPKGRGANLYIKYFLPRKSYGGGN